MAQQVIHPIQVPLNNFVTREHRGWMIAAGIISIIGGLFAVAFPFVATIAATQFVGILFLVGALSYFVGAWHARHDGKWLYPFGIGLLFGGAGFLLLRDPMIGALSLTLLFALVLGAQGLFEVAGSYMLWESRGSGWLAVSGVLSLAVALIVLAGLPFTALWVVGLLMGINLLSSGFAMIMLVSEAKFNRRTATAS